MYRTVYWRIPPKTTATLDGIPGYCSLLFSRIALSSFKDILSGRLIHSRNLRKFELGPAAEVCWAYILHDLRGHFGIGTHGARQLFIMDMTVALL